jgi:hypothetical protein
MMNVLTNREKNTYTISMSKLTEFPANSSIDWEELDQIQRRWAVLTQHDKAHEDYFERAEKFR